MLLQKSQHVSRLGREARFVACALNCARLRDAISQSALLTIVETQLELVPHKICSPESKGDPYKPCLIIPPEVADLNALVDFRDGTNTNALRLLTRCRLFVESRYGWILQLSYDARGSQCAPFPWKALTCVMRHMCLCLEIPSEPLSKAPPTGHRAKSWF